MKCMPIAALACVIVVSTATYGLAQEPRVLVYQPWSWRIEWVGFALTRAGVSGTGTGLADIFLERLREREWELIIIRSYEVWPRADEILEELDLHLSRGGRLLIQHAELDEWPELQEFLGLEDAFDLLPEPVDLFGKEPYHPSIDESGGSQVDLTLPLWPDVGDILVPSESGYIIAEYVTGGAAVVVTHSTQIIINGAEWDGYGAPHHLLADQIKWLLSCPPDLDGNGVLDFFDFLQFQNLFAAGHVLADFAYDRRLDFFDFLEFQNAFVAGCP